jgi:hypothetical protein
VIRIDTEWMPLVNTVVLSIRTKPAHRRGIFPLEFRDY